MQGPGKVIRPGDRPIVDRPEQQIADPDILLGARQEPWWLAILLSRAVLEGEPVGKGMEGRDGGEQPSAEPGDDTITELASRTLAEGESQDGRRRERIHRIADPGGDRLNDRRRLAGAGPGQYEQRTGPVVDDLLLLRIEYRRGRGRDWRRVQSERHRSSTRLHVT